MNTFPGCLSGSWYQNTAIFLQQTILQLKSFIEVMLWKVFYFFGLFVCLFRWWLKTKYSMQRYTIISRSLISQQEGLHEWWFSGSWFQLWVCKSSHGLAVSPSRPAFPIHQSSCHGEKTIWNTTVKKKKKKNTQVVLIVPHSFPRTAHLYMEKLTSYGKLGMVNATTQIQ